MAGKAWHGMDYFGNYCIFHDGCPQLSIGGHSINGSVPVGNTMSSSTMAARSSRAVGRHMLSSQRPPGNLVVWDP